MGKGKKSTWQNRGRRRVRPPPYENNFPTTPTTSENGGSDYGDLLAALQPQNSEAVSALESAAEGFVSSTEESHVQPTVEDSLEMGPPAFAAGLVDATEEREYFQRREQASIAIMDEAQELIEDLNKKLHEEKEKLRQEKEKTWKLQVALTLEKETTAKLRETLANKDQLITKKDQTLRHQHQGIATRNDIIMKQDGSLALRDKIIADYSLLESQVQLLHPLCNSAYNTLSALYRSAIFGGAIIDETATESEKALRQENALLRVINNESAANAYRLNMRIAQLEEDLVKVKA